MAKRSTPQARREAETTIKEMAEALGGTFRLKLANGRFVLSWGGVYPIPEGTVTADTLDDAYIAALHKKAGTEEAPF